ncbi:cysteine desulfurase IscS [Geodermatophilus nigrescens]|uniref:Cysteine desulfurase IscS n=2 Tax=Geodermatophilus nigrescens TaxID=1070870 RepID=A0A1M5M9G0_9ACTN|nr:cysteine desulfurase IscS [Geodermatophilus nigrescens]
MTRPIYLDAAASTPLDPVVLEAMRPVLQEGYGNPSSSHWAGRRAQRLVERAREQVAAIASGRPSGVIFTSGATEANNLALHGLLASAEGKRRSVVSCVTEHPAVLEPLRALAARGIPVRLVGVDEDGRLDLDELVAAVNETTLLVTVMAANNETGVLTDLATVCEVAHSAGALVHSDASQILAWGALPGDHQMDLVTVSGHKMHGPQGIGALVAGRTALQLLRPVTHGGGQERGLRSGTLNVAGAVGLGAAAELATETGQIAAGAVQAQRDALLAGLQAQLPVALLNGHVQHRLPGILNVAVGDAGDEVEADAVLAHMPTLAAATGSACSSGAPGHSHVLSAMGLPVQRVRSSLRFSLSRLSDPETVPAALPLIIDAVREVRTRMHSNDPQVDMHEGMLNR